MKKNLAAAIVFVCTVFFLVPEIPRDEFFITDKAAYCTFRLGERLSKALVIYPQLEFAGINNLTPKGRGMFVLHRATRAKPTVSGALIIVAAYLNESSPAKSSVAK